VTKDEIIEAAQRRNFLQQSHGEADIMAKFVYLLLSNETS
jgi:hypothetical protein